MTTYFQIYLKDCVKHIVHLLRDSPLEIFRIYSAVLSMDYPVTEEFWTSLLLAHGTRLLGISVHRTLISWEAVHSICVECTKLEQLCRSQFFGSYEFAFSLAGRTHILIIIKWSCAQDKPGSCLSFAKALRTIHINYLLGDRVPLSFINFWHCLFSIR
jgi:hypothetical protein